MIEVEFGNRSRANDLRDKVTGSLAATDDRREKTVKLKDSTPENVVKRLRTEAMASQTHSETAGQAELSQGEIQHLKQNHGSFSWQKHGFEAMRAKAALQKKGATEWLDFYEPGEGIGGSLKNLRSTKERSAATGAGIGVGGQRTDEEEISGKGRQARQMERAQGEQVNRAKRPAFGGDAEAIDFLQEERQFNGDVFDVAFSTDDTGRVAASGRDVEEMQDAHEERSQRAQTIDERRSAKLTHDPLEWAQAKDEYDFPGVDTVEPDELHEERSERAQTVDEREFAAFADTEEQWARHPDRYDWPGVDAPASYGPTAGEALPEDEQNRYDPGALAGTGLAPSDFELGAETEAEIDTRTEERGMSWGLAGGGEADLAFLEAEEERASGGDGDFLDDRPQNDALTSFGVEADVRQEQGRDSREAVEQASEFGVDDRSEDALGDRDAMDVGEQGGLVDFGGGVRENESLFDV